MDKNHILQNPPSLFKQSLSKFANTSLSTMCDYCGQEPGSQQHYHVYSEMCFCVALYISHVITSLVFCCSISAICISLGQNACWSYLHFKTTQVFLKLICATKHQHTDWDLQAGWKSNTILPACKTSIHYQQGYSSED